MLHPVYGVSLGAGDSNFITIKALRIIEKSDVIFYPGSEQNGFQKSFSYGVLEKIIPLQKKCLKGFFLEMKDDRKQATKIYKQTAEKIILERSKGQKVAVVCEGDLHFFGSFCYLIPFFRVQKIPFETLAGISSMQVLAGAHQIPLAMGAEKIAVLPKIKTLQEITTTLENFETLVLLKIKPYWKNLRGMILKNKKNWDFYYGEHLGTPLQKIITPAENLPENVPYFSILILKNKQ